MVSGLRLISSPNITGALFGSKLLMDFSTSTYNTQILCLTGAIISEAHYNDKYNYVQITHKARPSTTAYYFCIPGVNNNKKFSAASIYAAEISASWQRCK